MTLYPSLSIWLCYRLNEINATVETTHDVYEVTKRSKTFQIRICFKRVAVSSISNIAQTPKMPSLLKGELDSFVFEALFPKPTTSRKLLAFDKLAQGTSTVLIGVAEFHGHDTVVHYNANGLFFVVATLQLLNIHP
jgi:hypothetical protein